MSTLRRSTRSAIAPVKGMRKKAGAKVTDKTVPSRDLLQLPDERNGLLMVFRTFDRVSYALILDITQGVKVGDRLANPN